MDLFIYNWKIEDELLDVSSDDPVLKTRGYGFNVQNEEVLITLEDGCFRPWLSIEVKNTTNFKIENLISFLKKNVCHYVQYYRIEQLKKNPNPSDFVYFYKSEVNKKLYFYGENNPLLVFRIKFINMKMKNIFYFRFRKVMQENVSYSNLYKLHEKEPSPLLQFLSEYKLPSVGWIHVESNGIRKVQDELTYTRKSKEYYVNPSRLSILENQEKYQLPIFKSLSFDFEAYSHVETRMPMAKDKKDPVFQIGFTTFDKDAGEVENLLTISVKMKMKKIPRTNIKVVCFENEKKMLQYFCDYIKEYNPTIVMGYNIFGFDLPFLHEKCRIYNIDLSSLGMAKERSAQYCEVKWTSSAYSCQEFHFYDYDGRILLDLLPVIKRDYKLANYKLKTVSAEFLSDENKDPMTVKGIFEAYRLGSLQGDLKVLAKCGKYCSQDSKLVLRIFDKLNYLVGLIEMARLCNTQIMDLYVKGQQLKVFSQIYKKCFLEKRLVDSYENIDENVKKLFQFDNYTGAFVFPPVPGKYSWVCPFDFTSLYPTTIIANNICYSTMVLDEKIPDSECHVISWEEKSRQYCFRFKKEPIGVLPSLLVTLLDQRNKTKKQLKNSTDDFVKNVLDKRQLAYKISANSCYGMMGVTKGFLPFLPGAMSTTSMGRKYITEAARYVSSKFKGEIIYGDSVHKDTIVYIQSSMNEIKLYNIESYFNFYKKDVLPYEQFKSNDTSLAKKQQIIFNSDKYKVMTKSGWSPIKRLIRHNTKKQMYKVYTSSGSIIVTEDHSLLLADGNASEIKPSDLAINEHQLLAIDNLGEISENLFYSKEDWDYQYEQVNSFLFFPEECSPKYISYIFFTYAKKFPNLRFCFVEHENQKKYAIDLENKLERDTGIVLKVESMGETTDFVYDIETLDGSFHAGITLCVKNTDSIYVSFKDIPPIAEKVWKNALNIEKHLLETSFFPKPMALLFEAKLYKEFLILTKKRYMAYTCNQFGQIDDKLTIRGVILARRDNCSWTRTLYENVVRQCMLNTSFEKLLEEINLEMLKLMQWDPTTFNINQFVITKLLNEGYKIRELPKDMTKLKKRLNDLEIDSSSIDDSFLNQIDVYNQEIQQGGGGQSSHPIIREYLEKSLPAHAQLAAKMEKRGQPIASGSRLEYIVISHRNDPDTKLFSKLECPDYFCSYSDVLRMDRLYYFKSIVYHIDQILTTVFPSQKDPLKKIYNYHLSHFKMLNQIKQYNKTTIILGGKK
jgi:DNA polymerase elongation subunit (family B)